MVVVWGNILSLWGNVFAIAVDILVFDAFFPHNDNRKKRWSYILLFCLIFTSLSILIGTKLGYTFKMLQEIALIYVLCVFLYQSRWDRRFFIVVTVYSVLFSYSHWFESFCLYVGNLDYEEYIWNVPLYSVLFFVRGFISLFVALIIKNIIILYTQGLMQALGFPYLLYFLFAHCLCSGRYIPTRKNNVYGRFVC